MAPVVRFYAGEWDEAAVLRAAETGTGGERTSRTCEAHYYLGAASTDPAHARDFLIKALASGARDVEVGYAREDLAHMRAADARR